METKGVRGDGDEWSERGEDEKEGRRELDDTKDRQIWKSTKRRIPCRIELSLRTCHNVSECGQQWIYDRESVQLWASVTGILIYLYHFEMLSSHGIYGLPLAKCPTAYIMSALL